MNLAQESEEALREAAASGNAKAAIHYIQNGVKVNAQNRMNQWTALHWASHRGYAQICTILLQNGADATLANLKGQTAADLAKNADVRKLFGLSVEEAKPEIATPEAPGFVPTYIREPDLSKAWSLPGDSPSALPPASTTWTSPAADSTTIASTSSTRRDLLVYNGKRDDEFLLGSVWVDKQSIEQTIQQIREELDDVPEGDFGVGRHNGERTIPINKKQRALNTLDFFQPGDALVITKKD
ncbi:hypothetical protein SmJEL517_g02848 [Synchytrium microbalum]|uniref:Uncharacterized protein n=1 Tax=Synchytrium microbalum TaxID=1806994 RepID=A0A507C5Y9_9FUNG|nr:uncharacterized protein SmJEL517_g02848 [Synchytrium microbalum]TPX34519.1 hypothetical protein SmJEL517_g02848 [Synchytrium microbalum]